MNIINQAQDIFTKTLINVLIFSSSKKGKRKKSSLTALKIFQVFFSSVSLWHYSIHKMNLLQKSHFCRKTLYDFFEAANSFLPPLVCLKLATVQSFLMGQGVTAEAVAAQWLNVISTALN